MSERTARAELPTADELAVMPGWQRRQLAIWGTHRARVGAVLGMAGGATVVVATFLPWLVGRRSVTGWDLWTRARDVGHNPWFLVPADTSSWSVLELLYTGLTTVVLGAVTLLGAAVLLAAHTRPPPTRLVVRAALVGPAILASVVAVLVTSVNLFQVWLGPRSPHVSVGVGLWIAFVGALVGMLGVALSAAGKGRRAQRRWERENVPAGAGPDRS